MHDADAVMPQGVNLNDTETIMKNSTASLISSKRAAEADALRVYGPGAKVYRGHSADGRGATVKTFNGVGAVSADGAERPIAPRAGEWEEHQTLRNLLSRVCVVLTEES